MTTLRKIRVLIVDDSSIIRSLLSKLLARDPGIEVVGTAPDPFVAREKLVALKPDVMTLDIEMPRMDGITFLRAVMAHFPTPTIVISSLSAAGSSMALSALEAGAFDVMAKPEIDVTQSLEKLGAQIVERVKAAARARVANLRPQAAPATARPRTAPMALARTTHQIIALASSTGGTEALKVLLAGFPADAPGTVIVQHMPPAFTRGFATQLGQVCALEVREAQDGDRVGPGLALLAPGNFHMELYRSGGYYHVRLHQEPTLHGVRPAADFLLRTVAQHAGANAIGVVLTGMGRDGAAGLLAMRQAGGFTVAQDEATSVIFGMPKAAIEAGATEVVLPLPDIAGRIMQHLRR